MNTLIAAPLVVEIAIAGLLWNAVVSGLHNVVVY
jgi:hypothetical protein